MARPDEVLLWTVDLDAIGEAVERLEPLLAPDERERARGLPERRRREFTAGRATARAALAERSGRQAAELRLTTEEGEKPALEGPAELHFNVSHAGRLVLVALAEARPLGIDVEEIRPRAHLDGVAGRVFSEPERGRLAQLEGSEELEFFYGTWTAREACLKSTGRGWPTGPEGFDPPLWPAGLDEAVPVPAEAGPLAMRRWRPAPGYVAALVAEGEWRIAAAELPAAVASAVGGAGLGQDPPEPAR